MQTANIIARLVCGSEDKEPIHIMYEYDWLFTQEERREEKRRRLANAVKVKEDE